MDSPFIFTYLFLLSTCLHPRCLLPILHRSPVRDTLLKHCLYMSYEHALVRPLHLRQGGLSARQEKGCCFLRLLACTDSFYLCNHDIYLISFQLYIFNLPVNRFNTISF